MASLCKLCGKNISFFAGNYTVADLVICEDCYNEYKKVLDSISDLETFDTMLNDFKNKHSIGDAVNIVKSLEDLKAAKMQEIEQEKQKLEDEEAKAERLRQEEERAILERARRQEEEKQKEIERQKKTIELEQENRIRLQQENSHKIENLKRMGFDGYYEYRVINLCDMNDGRVYTESIENKLNSLGLDGWHLKCAYSNEIGVNSNSNGFGGISSGTNATIDQNILIFERFVRFNKE